VQADIVQIVAVAVSDEEGENCGAGPDSGDTSQRSHGPERPMNPDGFAQRHAPERLSARASPSEHALNRLSVSLVPPSPVNDELARFALGKLEEIVFRTGPEKRQLRNGDVAARRYPKCQAAWVWFLKPGFRAIAFAGHAHSYGLRRPAMSAESQNSGLEEATIGDVHRAIWPESSPQPQ